MANFNSVLIPFALALVALSGCTKYDQDGSLFHLRSPEKRILGTWESVRVQEVGVEADTNMTELLGSNNLRLDVEFRDDEGVTIFNEGEELTYEGTWTFNEDASILLLEVSNMETVGPFYLDSAGENQNALHATYAELLLVPDTFIFEAGTYTDVTDDVWELALQLMSTYTAFTYTGGGAFFDYEIGDDVTGVMGDFIDDLLSEGLIDSTDDIEGIIAGMLDEYGVELTVQEVSAEVSGWDDPNLAAALFAAHGLQVDIFLGALASSSSDAVILAFIADNLGLSLSETYTDQLKELSIYWKILELELDDLQAYQFREYDGEDIYDYSYLLRFEQQSN
jgi:hypothetical protein